MKSKEEFIQDIMRVLQNIDHPEITEEMKLELYRLISQFAHLMLGNVLAGFADSILEAQALITHQLHENMERVMKKRYPDSDGGEETVH
jgi:hypothetical protein